MFEWRSVDLDLGFWLWRSLWKWIYRWEGYRIGKRRPASRIWNLAFRIGLCLVLPIRGSDLIQGLKIDTHKGALTPSPSHDPSQRCRPTANRKISAGSPNFILYHPTFRWVNINGGNCLSIAYVNNRDVMVCVWLSEETIRPLVVLITSSVVPRWNWYGLNRPE